MGSLPHPLPAQLLTRVPKSAQSFVATMVRTIFAQPDAETVHEQHARVLSQLEGRFAEAAALLDEAGPEILAFTSFPKEHWRQLWSNNSLERLNREIRRRTDVVGIFPDRASIIRLVGALLAEQHDEWQVVRRYMECRVDRESTYRSRRRVRGGDRNRSSSLNGRRG